MADHLSLRSKTNIGFAVLLLVAFFPLTGLAGGGAGSGGPVILNAVTPSTFIHDNPSTKNQTSVTITTIQYDLLVVITEAFNGSNLCSPSCANAPRVSSITDTSGSTYTFRTGNHCEPCFQASDEELWTTTAQGASMTVTVTWNMGVKGFFFVGDYKNALGVASLNNTVSKSPFTPADTNITMTGNNSVVVDGFLMDDVNAAVCTVDQGLGQDAYNQNPGLVTWSDSRIKERNNWCDSLTPAGFADYADTSPSSSSLFEHQQILNSNPSFSGGYEGNVITVSAEITPNQKDQPNECTRANVNTLCPQSDTDSFCSPSGQTCHINYADKASGATAASQAIHGGTSYCTGVTTASITTTVTSSIFAGGLYSVESRNTTGLVLRVGIDLFTTQPPTTFGACSSTGTWFENLNVTKSTTGKGSTAVFTVEFAQKVPGTYWVSYSITPNINALIDSLGGVATAAAPGSTIVEYQLN